MDQTCPQKSGRINRIVDCFLRAYAPQRRPERLEGKPE
jgi:hypothetical protein